MQTRVGIQTPCSPLSVLIHFCLEDCFPLVVGLMESHWYCFYCCIQCEKALVCVIIEKQRERVVEKKWHHTSGSLVFSVYSSHSVFFYINDLFCQHMFLRELCRVSRLLSVHNAAADAFLSCFAWAPVECLEVNSELCVFWNSLENWSVPNFKK